MTDAARERTKLAEQVKALRERHDKDIDNIEGRLKEYVTSVRACEEEDTKMSDEIHRIAIWRDGNGAFGAERRLQDVEAAAIGFKRVADEVIEKADMAIRESLGTVSQTVHDTLNEREKTRSARLRAYGPFILAGINVAGLIAVAIIALHNPVPVTNVDVNVKPAHVVPVEPHR